MLINLLLYKILNIAFYAMTAYTRIESKMSHFRITRKYNYLTQQQKTISEDRKVQNCFNIRV